MASMEFAALPHPNPDEPGADLELWGRLRGVDGDTVLFEAQWDLAEFAQWFAAHLRNFLFDRLTDVVPPTSLMPGESLAQSLRELPARLDDAGAPDAVLDQLYEYRTRHTLRFGMRGSTLPPVVLGMNGAEGELSRSDGAEWARPVPMAAFLADATMQLRQLITYWEVPTPAAARRADALVAALSKG